MIDQKTHEEIAAFIGSLPSGGRSASELSFDDIKETVQLDPIFARYDLNKEITQEYIEQLATAVVGKFGDFLEGGALKLAMEALAGERISQPKALYMMVAAALTQYGTYCCEVMMRDRLPHLIEQHVADLKALDELNVIKGEDDG